MKFHVVTQSKLNVSPWVYMLQQSSFLFYVLYLLFQLSGFIEENWLHHWLTMKRKHLHQSKHPYNAHRKRYLLNSLLFSSLVCLFLMFLFCLNRSEPQQLGIAFVVYEQWYALNIGSRITCHKLLACGSNISIYVYLSQLNCQSPWMFEQRWDCQ